MEAASFRLAWESREGYLRASIFGERDSFDVTMGAVLEIAKVSREKKAGKLLVEHDVPGPLTSTEVYTIAKELPDLFRGVQVAFVIHHATVRVHPEFLELVARNRGANGRLFQTVSEAERWLLETP